MIISISAAAATVKTLVLSRHHFNYTGKNGKIKTKKLTAQVANQMDCGKLVRREEEKEEEEEELSDNFIFGDKLIITSNWLIGSETQCSQTVHTQHEPFYLPCVSGSGELIHCDFFFPCFFFHPKISVPEGRYHQNRLKTRRRRRHKTQSATVCGNVSKTDRLLRLSNWS